MEHAHGRYKQPMRWGVGVCAENRLSRLDRDNLVFVQFGQSWASWDCLSMSYVQTSVRVAIMPHRCFFLNFSICFISTFFGRRRDVFCLLRLPLCLVKKCESYRCIFICQNLPDIYQISAWADGLGTHWIFFSFSSLLLIRLCFLFCWFMLRFWCFCETLPLSLRLRQLSYSNSTAVQIFVK